MNSKTLRIFFLILLIHTSSHAQFGKKWLLCSGDDQCAKVDGVCGKKDSVNKKFIQDFSKFANQLNAAASCVKLSEKEIADNELASAKCISGQCKIVFPSNDKK